MYLYGRPIGPCPRARYTRVGADFGPGVLPNAGDVQGYMAKGNALLSQASAAIQGNGSAVAGLLADGVTVVASGAASGSPIATVAVDILGGAVSGFAMGGPVGAVGGALAGMAAAAGALGGSGSSLGAISADAGAKAIQAHLLGWAVPNRDVAINPATGQANPVGWALYDYVAQVAARPTLPNGNPGSAIATPFLWLLDPNAGFGINRIGSFAENGDDPQNRAAYLTHATNTVLILPGKNATDSLQYAVLRGPPPHTYSAILTNALFMPGPQSRGLVIPDPTKADAFLALATIFGMLNQGALARSIASELMMQQAIYAELVPSHQPSPEALLLLDFYTTMAKTEPAPPVPVTFNFGALGGLLGRLHVQPAPAPKPLFSNLGSLHVMPAGLISSSRQQWVSYYLAQTPHSG
jgi:hypothetical protein